MTSADDERARQLAEVLRLRLIEGKSIRGIARATKLGRRKVRSLLRLATKSTARVAAQRRSSILGPYEDAMRLAAVEGGLSAGWLNSGTGARRTRHDVG